MEPLSEKRYLELHAPAGGDFLAARERLLAALPDGCRLTLGCLQQLYPVLSAADYRVTVTLCPGPGGTDAVRVEPGDTTAEHYGLCLDIGSTIMQMELVDLVRGRTLSQAACTNSQTQFGANILDRILAVKADRENLKTLQALTLSDVRGMIDTCCRAADIRPEAISAMTVGGNTTMLHFFLGCDPWLVFQSPYTPVFFDPGVIRAAELGLPICGNVYCMPAIANYLGGDITIAECGTDVSAGGGIPYVSVAGQVGFDLVEQWIVSGVVQPGAAVDCRYADGSSVEFSEVPDPGAPRTYTIAGRDELLAFAPQDGSAVGETVQDLTILDPDNTISDHDLSFVKNRVGKIAGTLTVEGTSLTTTEVLFNDGGFTVDGGIVFRNCAQLFNLNGMKSMTAVGGDLVFENCPKITTNWGAGNCLSQIESVAGSVKLSGSPNRWRA